MKIFKKKKKDNNISEILKGIKKDFVKFISDLRKNPKKTILNLINTICEIVKNNLVFFVFIITNLFIGVSLRYLTIHTLDNLLLIKPILGDLTIILFLGGISFLLKERKVQFRYLLIISIVFSIICIVNSVYYTFFTSYVSVSFISTSRYAVQVGDAIVKNVLKIQ